LVVDVPSAAPDPNCSVVALEVQGLPVVYEQPKITAATEQIVQPVRVTLTVGSPTLKIHYTLDGSTPAAGSPVYTGPIVISDDATLKACSFDGENPVSDVASETFTKVTPSPAVDRPDAKPGLAYAEYEGDWDDVPDFGSLVAADQGTMDTIGVDKWGQKEHFGLLISGLIKAPQDGVYEFNLGSDDGSKLWIDGKLAVDNGGVHSLSGKSASVALAAGYHTVQIGYFNKTGGLGLRLAWSLAGDSPAPVPASALFR
jgi:hypothetical protein